MYGFLRFRLRDESWNCHRFCPGFCPRFCPRFWGRLGPPFCRISSPRPPTPAKPSQKEPPATPYPRKSPQSLPYGPSSLPHRRNPYPTRIFLDVCASKSSRSPPYAAARNFCTLNIFYMPACSIFGAPKFSTCDLKNFKARPIELLGRVGTPHML